MRDRKLATRYARALLGALPDAAEQWRNVNQHEGHRLSFVFKNCRQKLPVVTQFSRSVIRWQLRKIIPCFIGYVPVVILI